MRFHSVNYGIVVKPNRYGGYMSGDGYHDSRRKVTGKFKVKPAPEYYLISGNYMV